MARASPQNAKPMYDRINRNTEKSRALATLRDTLLPKLLSGEVRRAQLLGKAHNLTGPGA